MTNDSKYTKEEEAWITFFILLYMFNEEPLKMKTHPLTELRVGQWLEGGGTKANVMNSTALKLVFGSISSAFKL